MEKAHKEKRQGARLAAGTAIAVLALLTIGLTFDPVGSSEKLPLRFPVGEESVVGKAGTLQANELSESAYDSEDPSSEDSSSGEDVSPTVASRGHGPDGRLETSYQGWSQPPGKGLNLEILNKCLEKTVRYYLDNEPISELDEEFPNIPVMDSRWNNGGKYYSGGRFGNFTTWAIAKEKRLSYMFILKAGSMTFRGMLAACKDVHNAENAPCELWNREGRPWQVEDAKPEYGEGGGFYSNKILSDDLHDIDFRWDFKERIEDTVRFTYVTDPLGKFIGGFRQLNHALSKSDAMDELGADPAFQARFERSARKVFGHRSKIMNYHYASNLNHLLNAAVESTVLAREKDPTARFAAPFDFVGRLASTTAQPDWDALTNITIARYPEAEPNLNATLMASNEAKRISPHKVAELRKKSTEANLGTLMRQIKWGRRNARSTKALGPYAKVATMPADVARYICAALYSEYICLGYQFPPQCTDEDGRYNVTEYPAQVVGSVRP